MDTAVTRQAVVVAGDDGEAGLTGLDPATGAPLWTRPPDTPIHSTFAELPGIDDLVILLDQRAVAIALDPATGEVRWEAPQKGYGPRDYDLADDGTVLAVGKPGGGFGLIEVAAGATRWEQPPPAAVSHIGQLEIHDDVVLVVGHIAPREDLPVGTNQSAASGTVLSAYDLGDGAPRWSVQVPGRDVGLVAADQTAVLRVWAAIYGLDIADGSQRWLHLPSEDSMTPLGEREGRLLLGHRGDQLRILDPLTGAITPGPEPAPASTPEPGATTHEVGELVVWTSPTGDVVAADRRTGEERWRTPIGSFGGTPAGSEFIVVPTLLGAVALDAAEGAILWSWVRDAEFLRP